MSELDQHSGPCDSFGICELCTLKGEIERLSSRGAELEHWFHGYMTPEKSMAAMLERIAHLEQGIAEVIAAPDYTNPEGMVRRLKELLETED